MARNDNAAWQALRRHADETGNRHLSELLAGDASRFDSMSLRRGGLLLDYSKQRMTAETVDLLMSLARECDLSGWIARLFDGENVNDTENRPALHMALRSPQDRELWLGGINIVDEVQQTLSKMGRIVERIHAGQWRGYSGLPVDTIVNIGVGGSDLGPFMSSRALADVRSAEAGDLEIHFVSSMDGSHIAAILDRLNPETTLFVISSKSFTTIDTLSNANTALQWLRRSSGAQDEVLFRRHFIGVSANDKQMAEWGIAPDSRLKLWDWVGGRYSMWSAIGLPLALEIGIDNFHQLLAGAHDMDEHFRHSDLEVNLPVVLALISVWNTNFLDIRAHSILPYDGRLGHLPAYLQQLEMESNGKSVSREGDEINYDTCPILWGEIGPNAQHAFYQLLHQGTEPVMCDFIVAARRYHDRGNDELQQQHTLALANCLAQSRILALGDTVMEGRESLPFYKRYRGNQPSSTILLDELTPFNLGQLIALYEHKVFVQSVIWDINPFDQWGVELGKQMATGLLEPLTGADSGHDFDGSTNGLLAAIRNERQNQS